MSFYFSPIRGKSYAIAPEDFLKALSSLITLDPCPILCPERLEIPKNQVEFFRTLRPALAYRGPRNIRVLQITNQMSEGYSLFLQGLAVLEMEQIRSKPPIALPVQGRACLAHACLKAEEFMASGRVGPLLLPQKALILQYDRIEPDPHLLTFQCIPGKPLKKGGGYCVYEPPSG